MSPHESKDVPGGSFAKFGIKTEFRVHSRSWSAVRYAVDRPLRNHFRSRRIDVERPVCIILDHRIEQIGEHAVRSVRLA